MGRLLRAETRKLLTTKLWWGMLLGAVAFSCIGVVAVIATNGLPESRQPPLTSPLMQRSIFAQGQGGYLFTLILGIIAVATEYRHFTSRPTFLIEPRRGHVVVAKLAVLTGVGAVYAIACVGSATLIAVVWLAQKGVTIEWSQASLGATIAGDAGVVVIYAIVGVGVGVLVRNQVAAVIGALLYLLFVESLISITPGIKEIYRFLPGAAARAITGAGGNAPAAFLPTLLSEAWQGALVLVAWGLLFALAGWLLTVRRDVP